MSDGIKQKIIAFASGFACAVLAVLAFVLGRKKSMVDMGGIRSSSDKYDECTERTDTVTGRVESAQESITDTIRILENARKRAEEGTE